MELLLKQALGENHSPYAVDAITHGNIISEDAIPVRYTDLSLVLCGGAVLQLADALTPRELDEIRRLCGLHPAPLADMNAFAKCYYTNGIPDTVKIVRAYEACNPAPLHEDSNACRLRYWSWVDDVVKQMEDLKRLAELGRKHANRRREWERTQTLTLNLGEARSWMRELDAYKRKYESMRAAVMQLARVYVEKNLDT
jgi:hypothetical protein